MLSIRDCLDYCDLTDDEVSLIAEHEDITDAAAATMACGLVQTSAGTLLLTQYMEDLLERAQMEGRADKAALARDVLARFKTDHPVRH